MTGSQALHTARPAKTGSYEPIARPTLMFIQCLRGIAALLVVLFHLGERSTELLGRDFAFDIFRMGRSGVGFFFVLSGFIIFFVHKRDLGEPSRIRQCAYKRFVRIYPFYLIVTCFALTVYLGGYGDPSKRTPAIILRSLLLLPEALAFTQSSMLPGH
jgi:exopolysaccharide production protein ExoZ